MTNGELLHPDSGCPPLPGLIGGRAINRVSTSSGTCEEGGTRSKGPCHGREELDRPSACTVKDRNIGRVLWSAAVSRSASRPRRGGVWLGRPAQVDQGARHRHGPPGKPENLDHEDGLPRERLRHLGRLALEQKQAPECPADPCCIAGLQLPIGVLRRHLASLPPRG